MTEQMLNEQPVRAVRSTVRQDDLMRAQGEALTALWAALRDRGAEPAGPPYVRYHAFGDEIDLEIGVPVGEPGLATGTRPGGPAVVHTHLGGHDRLGDAYDRVQALVKEQGAIADGPGWEVYHWIDLRKRPDPAAWPAPDAWRTELVQPVRRP